MKLIAGLLLAVALLAAPANDQAVSAAQSWLQLVDTGKYADSWREASSYFRSRLPQQQWVAMVKSVREPLGPVVSRKQLSLMFSKTLPGAPDGNYAVVQFQTVLRNKASAVETLTVMADGDQWRAAGYFIK